MPRALSEIYLEDATIDGVPYPSQGGHPISLAYLNGALSPFFNLLSGWAPANETWEYASATTITVPSGATSRYQKGDKIRLKQGGGYKYFYIVSVADKLLTVTGGSDYTVANAAITDNYYSKAMNPQGWPVSLGQRVGDKEIWHEGNTNVLLWSGSFSEGTLTLPAVLKYTILRIRIDSGNLYIPCSRGVNRILGITMADNVTYDVSLSYNTKGVISYQACGGLQHTPSDSHGGRQPNLPVTEIWGVL